MKLPLLHRAFAALCALVLSASLAHAGTQILAGELCFQATSGINGMVGTLGTITGGSGGTNGTYGGVALTGGSGTGATANITVSGGAVTAVAVLNPGANYVVGDTLSAASGNIGNVTGFSVSVASIAVNSAVAGGNVGFYIPGTLTFKATYQDAAETILNTNPVTLNQNGCAIVYGDGTYRQILKDSLGNTIWDQVTSAPASSANTVSWGNTSSGTANAQTVAASGFILNDGQQIAFVAGFTNTGAATLNANGLGAINIVKDVSTGPTALTGGELVAGNVEQVTYTASSASFHLQGASLAIPTGTIIDFSGSVLPSGWLFANGACVSITTYPALFNVFGHTWEASACPGGQFGLPDMRGRVTAGIDNMGGAAAANRLTLSTMSSTGLAGVGGVQFINLTIAQLPVFTPSGSVIVQFPGVTYSQASASGTTAQAGVANTFFNQNSNATSSAIGPTTFTLSMNSIGSGSNVPVIQPTIMTNKIVKY